MNLLIRQWHGLFGSRENSGKKGKKKKINFLDLRGKLNTWLGSVWLLIKFKMKKCKRENLYNWFRQEISELSLFLAFESWNWIDRESRDIRMWMYIRMRMWYYNCALIRESMYCVVAWMHERIRGPPYCHHQDIREFPYMWWCLLMHSALMVRGVRRLGSKFYYFPCSWIHCQYSILKFMRGIDEAMMHIHTGIYCFTLFKQLAANYWS